MRILQILPLIFADSSLPCIIAIFLNIVVLEIKVLSDFFKFFNSFKFSLNRTKNIFYMKKDSSGFKLTSGTVVGIKYTSFYSLFFNVILDYPNNMFFYNFCENFCLIFTWL